MEKINQKLKAAKFFPIRICNTMIFKCLVFTFFCVAKMGGWLRAEIEKLFPRKITGQKKNSKKAAVISFETLLKQIVTFKEKKNSNSGKIVHFSY